MALLKKSFFLCVFKDKCIQSSRPWAETWHISVRALSAVYIKSDTISGVSFLKVQQILYPVKLCSFLNLIVHCTVFLGHH